MPPPKGASISGLQCARAPVLARCSLDKKLRCGFRVVFFFFFTCFPRKKPTFLRTSVVSECTGVQCLLCFRNSAGFVCGFRLP